jgi:hypothetical protein
MKNFHDYLSESIATKKHTFRVKVAGEFTAEQETKLKGMLERYQVDNFKKISVTPIQELPLDFPQIKNCEVHIFEVVVDYPTTQQELTEYLSTGLEVSRQKLVVRRPGEASEEYQMDTEPRKGALLHDPEYKEAGDPKFEDYYGDKYNSGFVKELNDILKLQRKARGEEIPTEGAATYNVDTPYNNQSPVAKDQGTYVVKASNGV